jgi:hypothetical protein
LVPSRHQKAVSKEIPDSHQDWLRLVLGGSDWWALGMSDCPDKAADLKATKGVLNGAVAIVEGVSWLRHSGKSASVDRLLAVGANERELIDARPTWEQHRYHLRTEHGMGVGYQDGLWRFTGEAHVPGEGGAERKEITDGQYRAGYLWGRKFFTGAAERQEAISAQVKLGTNRSSAKNMVLITVGLLSGQNFKRALKDEAYRWYLDWILQDDGPDGQRTALRAAWAHLEYREEDGASHPRMRAILQHFENVLMGKAGPGWRRCTEHR